MKTMEEVCHYNGNIYIFAREQDFKTAPNKVEEKDQPETQQSNYENNIKTLVTTNNRKDKTRIENEIRNGYILQISGPQRSRVFTEPSNTE
ncbi:MAG: hypothetical protein LBU27_03920 [Candidatus Peribacteria bacterium]|jgi:hypothetical protein|nr:hypothetical protein [Candidatus Peribacteria bacterium]